MFGMRHLLFCKTRISAESEKNVVCSLMGEALLKDSGGVFFALLLKVGGDM